MSKGFWLRALGRAIDDMLARHRGFRHALKADHLPFGASLAEGVAHYGAGPLLHLWCECRAVEALRVVWRDNGSPAAEPWLRALGRAIDDLLVQHHGLRHALKADHPPFGASLAEGVAHYGAGRLFDLWAECRAVEALRVVWTGKASPAIEAAEAVPAGAIGAPETPQPVQPPL